MVSPELGISLKERPAANSTLALACATGICFSAQTAKSSALQLGDTDSGAFDWQCGDSFL